jgi:hypothetical protein
MEEETHGKQIPSNFAALKFQFFKAGGRVLYFYLYFVKWPRSG